MDPRKILLYDIETMPDMNAAMEKFPQLSDYPGLTLKGEINSIICFGYKWYGDGKKAKCVSVWDMDDWDGDINNDKSLCLFIHGLMEEANYVVTFNGKRFDERVIWTRFAEHRLPLLRKVKHYDLYQVIKRHFSFFRNNLKTAAKKLTREFKMSNEGWGLWVKVWKGVKASMKEMARYCAQDVNVMEPMLDKLMPLIPTMPNIYLHSDEETDGCPKCGSKFVKVHGYHYSTTTKSQRMKCKSCFSTFTPPNKKGLPKGL
jgi:hypothetical protein